MKAVGGVLDELSRNLMLGNLLDDIRARWGAFALVEHWKQGEFHHDLVLRIAQARSALGGEFLVVATNCNGGVKEVICLASAPDRSALWHSRCPDNPEFSGHMAPPVGTVRTEHWFDPCELLRSDARSEFRAEHRERQCGGGWLQRRDD